VELVAQEDGARLLVGLEQTVDGDLEVPGSLIRFHGEIENRVGDEAEKPGANAAVRLLPRCISRLGFRLASMCDSKPNLPHMVWKKHAHLLKLGLVIPSMTGT
jgi:hypothetical protein